MSMCFATDVPAATWERTSRHELLGVAPLARQVVSPDDSVLGGWANEGTTGLHEGVTYNALIRTAFNPAYWSSQAVVDSVGHVVVAVGEPSGPREFSQLAYNCGLFFGIAVQAYE